MSNIKPALKWDATGAHFYETGVDRGVCYPATSAGTYPKGVNWNGLFKVDVNAEGGDTEQKYANNAQYLNLVGTERVNGTISCYQYPEEFNACLGVKEVKPGIYVSQQNRTPFGFAFRSIIGNDTEGQAHAYKLTLIYNALATPADESYETVNESPDAKELAYEFATTPIEVPGMKPTSKLTIDSRVVAPEALAKIEAALYGIDAPAFSETTAYEVGDYVKHETKTYECTVAHSAGAWSASDFTEVENADAHLPLIEEIMAMVAEG